MIRINRNHPSIIAWSMTNEAFFTYNLDRAETLMADLVKLSRELDPTRPAAIGGAQRGDVDKLGDIAGYNGDGARLFIDPGVPNMVSEYGAISKPHDAYEPFFGELQPERFPWRSGAGDLGGVRLRLASRASRGSRESSTISALPKRSWHWYRNAYRGIAPPRVADRWRRRRSCDSKRTRRPSTAPTRPMMCRSSSPCSTPPAGTSATRRRSR